MSSRVTDFNEERPRRNRNGRTRADRTASLTEMDVAAIVEERFRGRHCYDHQSGSWLIERNGIWHRDATGETIREVQNICKNTGDPSFQTLRKVKAAEELSRYAPGIATTLEAFDCDRYLLGTPGGVVDLRTGEILPPNPELRISMSTAVTPDGSCPIPLWIKFVTQIMAGDEEAVRFLRAWFGYCLTGDTREQKMIFAYGSGRNGKGVLLRATAGIMGSYAHRAQVETFTAGPDRHPTDIAAMRGKRLVYCSETERNRKWGEARIKDVTGGDKLRARFMRQDEFEYQPDFKLYVSGNYEPAIETADQAMRNRFYVVPFDQVYEGQHVDQHLDEKLQAEWPGIFSWLIDGCLDWQANGFSVPAKVRTATDAYFDRQDVFAQWLDQECVRGIELKDTNKRLFKSWETFAKDSGEAPGTSKTFAERMNRAGFQGPRPTKIDGKNVRVYHGLKALIQ
jgi:putative DNA primase/helicase